MRAFKDPLNRCISSKNVGIQFFGVIIGNYFSLIVLLLLFLAVDLKLAIDTGCVTLLNSPRFVFDLFMVNRYFCFLVSLLLLILAWYSVSKITPILCLRKKEQLITRIHVVVLVLFGVCICCAAVVMSSVQNTNLTVVVAILAAVFSWAFQDTIKSVVAFYYLRFNGLLNIGDWIEVPSKGVDGMIQRISLTTVIIDNWDTTTSSCPINLLHSDHLRNNQKMMTGKTFGRMMKKTFIIDSGWIHTMKEEELDRLKDILERQDVVEKDFYEHFISKEAKAERLNAQLFRQYIYHWLMHNKNVSHEPRLIVRWMEQMPEGMPLQVYIFLNSTSLAPFEWQQSLIIEHIIETMAWFNLQLYQSPSGYDASNSNVYLAQKSATYEKGQSNDR